VQPHLLPIDPSGSVSGRNGYVVGLHAYLIVTRWPIRVRRRLCWRPSVWVRWTLVFVIVGVVVAVFVVVVGGGGFVGLVGGVVVVVFVGVGVFAGCEVFCVGVAA
jgi:hypothetical protein